MEDLEDVIEEVEHIFEPKPGGMIDRHRQDKARKEAAQKEREQAEERVEEPSYKAIKTTQISPESFGINIVNVPAGGNVPILPYNPYRYRAVITVLTAASSVILSKDAGSALSGIGFPLTTANGPLPLYGRGQIIGSSPLAIQVAVISELYAPEK